MDTPILWHFKVSHYNEKVRWALDYKSWPHTRRALIPGFHIPVTRYLTGQNKVPILQIGKLTLHNSSEIIEELERMRPDPPLYPSDPKAKERALSIQHHFDYEVAPEVRRLFWSTYLNDADNCSRMATDGFGVLARQSWKAAFPVMRPFFRKNMGIDEERLTKAKQSLVGHLDKLESQIGPKGYLVGESFTVADLSAAAVLTAIIRPPEFPYSLPEPWPEELIRMKAEISLTAGFQWTLNMYKKHRGKSYEV